VLRLYLHPSIRMEWGVGILWRLKSTPSVSITNFENKSLRGQT
jgi:hypothetical protein